MQIQLGPLSFDAVPVITDAPESYDGFGTFTVIRFDYPIDAGKVLTKHNARIALVRRDHLDWHLSRYSSGLYVGYHDEAVTELFPEKQIAEALFNRLAGKEAQ